MNKNSGMIKESIYPEVSYMEYGGKLREMLQELKDLIKEYGEDAVVRMDAGYNNISATLSYYRKEKPEETTRRITKEQKARIRKELRQKQAEEKEHKEYERLSKKYG